MSYNLLETLQEHLSGDVVSNLASLIGESSKNTESALQTALPSLLAAIGDKSTDSVSIGGLFNLLTGGGHDGGVLSNLGALSCGGDESRKLITEGGNVMLSIFGNKTAGLTELVSRSSGISNDAATRLLSFITPIILGLIGKHIKINSIENADTLANFLSGQNDLLKNLLPAGFSHLLAAAPSESTIEPVENSSLGEMTADTRSNVLEAFDKATDAFNTENIIEKAEKISDSVSDTLDRIGDTVEEFTEESIASVKEIAGNVGDSVSRMGSDAITEGQQFAQSAAAAFEDGAGEGRKLLPWILLAAALALIWGLLKSCGGPTEPETTAEVTAPDVGVSPSPVQAPSSAQSSPEATVEPAPIAAPVAEKTIEPDSGMFEKTLSTGYAIKAVKDGFIEKLVVFIESGDPVKKDLWFSMDGITFDTNKASFKPESEQQLTDIAAILKAFPKVKIKIGGYTDNTGNAKANKKLSSNRANAVKKSLISKEIQADRLEAEGYGSEHPVADNDSEIGRQQNRRIDIKVTQK